MPAATPVPAATVILLREGASSPEVLMLERHSEADFLPDQYVFPGGRVDPGDFELAERAVGITAAGARAQLPTVKPEEALGFFVAGVRETYEESGILLARRRGESELIGGETAARLAEHRLEVQAGDRPFADIVIGEDLELVCELLVPHAHWITPELVRRRYDTIFFSTRTPPGQRALHDGIESTDAIWIRPEDAIDQTRAGTRQIIFPTLLNLETLCGFEDSSGVLEASRKRPVVPVLPRMVEENGQRKLLIPAEAEYSTTEEIIRLPAHLKK